MKHFKRTVALLGVVFMVLMAMNFSGPDRMWPQWLKGKAQQYYGNINLWHINDDFSMKIPYESMLKKYEKQNFGVFVNVSHMTAEDAKTRMASGEQPDIITYSRSPFAEPQKMLAELDSTENPMQDKGELDGAQLAYTLYYDTYSLIINEELIDETEEDIPSVLEPSYILSTLTGLSYGEGVIPLGFTGYGGALNLLDALGEEAEEILYNQVSLKDFEQGKVAAAVCGSLELETYGGELPSYSVYQFSGFTDRGRFLSILKCEDENKLSCSKEIAAQLMGAKLQEQISEYAFSPEFGYTGLTSEVDIKLTRVFENELDEEAVINGLAEDRRGLLEKIREMCR